MARLFKFFLLGVFALSCTSLDEQKKERKRLYLSKVKLEKLCTIEGGFDFAAKGFEYENECGEFLREEKLFLRGYRVGQREHALLKKQEDLRFRELDVMSGYRPIGVGRSCVSSLDCLMGEACLSSRCAYSGQFCQSSLQCTRRGSCVSGRCRF